MDYEAKLAKRIKLARRLSRLTQESAALAAGIISRSHLAAIEGGRYLPTEAELLALSRVYGCDINDFYPEESIFDRKEPANYSQGEILRHLRAKAGLYQLQLAKALRVSNLSKIEKNHRKINVSKFPKAAKALGIPETEFYALMGYVPPTLRDRFVAKTLKDPTWLEAALADSSD